jgi:hypothetical protein
MRKRSAVVETPDPRQMNLEDVPKASPAPTQTSPDELPPGCDVQDNVFFVKCPDCGMHGGSLMHKRNETGRLCCFRCGKPFDERLTPEFVDAAREHWRATHRNGAQASPSKAAPKVEPESKVVPPNPERTGKVGIEVCEKCGDRVTVTALGKFYPCGHTPGPSKIDANPEPPRATPKREPAPAQSTHVHVHPDHVPGLLGERVTVVYGRELFSPKQFNTFEIGPFTYEVTVRTGETLESAMARGYEELRKFAAIEFKRKATDFLERLKNLGERIG